MTAMHLPTRSRTAAHWRTRIAVFFLAAGSLSIGYDAAAEEPITAVLKAREVSFIYRSSTTEYACYELENRVANILRAVGARDDVQVRLSNCDLSTIPSRSTGWENGSSSAWGRVSPTDRFRSSETDRDQSVHVRVRLMMPVEATPQVLAEIDKDKSRRDLVSRVTGNPSAALNDPIIFPATRQPITLSHRTVGIEPEDCQLLDQMTTSVFRELGVRVVRRNFSCDPRRSTSIPPQLTVEALLPAPLPATPSALDPAAAPTAPENEPAEPASETPPH